MKLIGGVVKVGIAAAAAYGVYSLFKDEIRETPTYKSLNEKYDVDNKVETATVKVKGTMKDTAKTVSEYAKTAKEKAVDIWDNKFVKKEGEEAADAAEEVKETAADAAEEVKDAVADAAEEVKDTAEEVKDAAEEAAADAASYAEVADAVNNIEID